MYTVYKNIKYKKADATCLHEVTHIFKQLTNNGYLVSIHKVHGYLMLLEEFKFLESSTVRRRVTDVVNVLRAANLLVKVDSPTDIHDYYVMYKVTDPLIDIIYDVYLKIFNCKYFVIQYGRVNIIFASNAVTMPNARILNKAEAIHQLVSYKDFLANVSDGNLAYIRQRTDFSKVIFEDVKICFRF